MHPLIDFSDLKEQDLQNKLAELTKKYYIARDASLKMQIAKVIDMCNAEIANRIAKQWEDQSKDQDNGLDKLINID